VQAGKYCRSTLPLPWKFLSSTRRLVVAHVQIQLSLRRLRIRQGRSLTYPSRSSFRAGLETDGVF
jgi:hypothetical protein